MSNRELTAQQTDPLGALNQRPISIVITIFALTLAIARTAIHRDGQVNLRVAIAGIVLVAVAAVVMTVATSPYRAPFTRRSFGVIVSCGILGLVAEAVSKAGHDSLIRDNWGSAVAGLLLLACAPYRPGRDLVVGTIVVAIVEGIVVWREVPGFATQAPPIAFLVVGLTPVVALGAGSAAYSSTLVRLVHRWLARASVMTKESALEMRPGIARSVQQDSVTALNREVVPFFTDLVERDEITDDDRQRAGRVAAVIRDVIVAETDRTWLEQALIDICPSGFAGTVVDRSHLAERMTTDQRTAIRALVSAMAVDVASDTSSLGIVLHDGTPVVRALVRMDSAAVDAAIRQLYAPYFAVLRIVFRDLQVDVTESLLTLRFSYDQH
ncbi:MAG: hypothetical protein JWP75_251 [Frondihabitans sp.]|nr:hypothetical protein [Frondihabitans sp.]